MTTHRPEPKHLAYIDALRGIAFLGVLTEHSALCVGDFFPKSILLRSGGYGVQLFFLASAITLCHSMATRSQIDKSPAAFFYIRRLFRIAPLFWLAMIFYWTCPAIMPAFWLGQFAPKGVRPLYFVLTGIFLHGWYPYTFNSIVPGGWSIAVEMTFYLIFPFLFLFLNSRKRVAAAIFFVILFAQHEGRLDSYLTSRLFHNIEPSVLYFFFRFWFPSQIGIFLIGIFAYHLLRSSAVQKFAANRFWANVVFLLVPTVLPGFLTLWKKMSVPPALLVVAALAAMIITISARAVPLIVNPIICYIGKVSYSCYLVHFALLGITLKILGVNLTMQHSFHEAGSSLSNFLLFSMIFGITLLLTLPVATVTLHLIETPGIKLGRFLLEWITSNEKQGSIDAVALTVPDSRKSMT